MSGKKRSDAETVTFPAGSQQMPQPSGDTGLADTVSSEQVGRPTEGPGSAAPKAQDSSPSKELGSDSLIRETAPANQLAFVDRQEHAASVIRMRRSLAIGYFVYTAFLGADWVASAYIQPGLFPKLLSIRLIVLAAVLWPMIRLWRRPFPSPTVLRIIELWIFGTASASITMMCFFFDGISSPYYMGIMVVVTIWGTIMSTHWKRGLLPVCVTGLMPTFIMAPAALFSERIAAQWQQPSAVALFLLIQIFFIGGTMGFVLLGGHMIWALRRQLFETRNIGRYRLKQRIGSGGMGEVWRAYHTALKRDIALKIIRSTGKGSAEAVTRFDREVRATSLLSHPNTIRVFDFGSTEDGLFYYAMELLEGQDLREAVKVDGPFSPERAAAVVCQVAWALAEAHDHGIVHRDIKPSNIFLVPVGDNPDFVKVLDFGIARVGGALGEATITHTGWIGGTPAYLSPEVARGERGDERIDVYALGAVLYFLLTGSAPFSHNNPAALLNAHMFEEPAPPSTKCTEPLPKAMDAIVLRCLAKDPDDRYPSAAELARELEAQLHDRHSPR